MNYSIKVSGKEIKVNKTSSRAKPYNHITDTEFTIFSMTNPCDLHITSQKEIETVVIRPKSLNIKYRFDRHNIYIHLDKPLKFSVEINGSITDNLLVFANAKREENIDINSEKVIYYPAGVHEADVIDLEGDDITLFMDEGATVHAKLRAKNCNNLKICGLGAICSERYDREDPRHHFCMELISCKNMIIRDITVLDSSSWSMRMMGCDDVHVDNVNILGHRGNSDGFDICGSRNVLVEHCFTRTADDSFVLKAFDTGNVENITYRDSTLWNDSARPIEIGVEVRADYVKNIKFENIDVLHTTTGYPVMGIHHGDRAKISNVEFSNIRIEDAPGAQIFDIRIDDSVWNKDTVHGGIDGVTVKDIYIVDPLEVPMSNSRIEGYSEDICVENVTVENINYLGQPIDLLELNKLDIMDHVKNVTVKPAGDGRVLPIKSSIEITKPFELNEKGFYNGTVEIKLTNNNNAAVTGKAGLRISPKNTLDMSNDAASFVLNSGEIISKEYDITLQPGKYVFTVASDNFGVESNWIFKTLDLVLGDDIENAPEYKIYNYYGNELDGVKLAVKDRCLIIESEALRDNEFTVYSAMPVPSQKREVVFSVEESDLGESTVLIADGDKIIAAPQLRNPMEIWMVFKLQPQVKEIKFNTVGGKGKKRCKVSFEDMGIEGNELAFDLSAAIPEVKEYRYPFSLFHTVCPQKNSHMFAKVKVD